MKRLLFVLTVGILAAASAERSASGSGSRVPVLLELFTSEGCSSCPPADRLLENFEKVQPVAGATVIVLSEHVDYWDEGGWKDPFSSAELTSRQRNYARQFGINSVYTPQLVVDGQAQFVGSDGQQGQRAIEKAARQPKAPVDVVLVGRNAAKVDVKVGFQSNGGKAATVFVALAEKYVESQVGNGENSGRRLRHVAVVRTLVPAGNVKAGETLSKELSLRIPAGAGKSGWRVVAFAQERSSGRVVGVSMLEL